MAKKITKLTKNAAFYLGKCIWWPLVKDFMPNYHPPSDHYPRALNFLTNYDRQKRFLQNEKEKGRSTKVASDFIIFAPGLSYDLSKFSDDFTPCFRLWTTITESLGKIKKSEAKSFVARNMMYKCAKFHEDSPSDKKVKFIRESE